VGLGEELGHRVGGEEVRPAAADGGFLGQRLGAVLTELEVAGVGRFGPGAPGAVEPVGLVDGEQQPGATARPELATGVVDGGSHRPQSRGGHLRWRDPRVVLGIGLGAQRGCGPGHGVYTFRRPGRANPARTRPARVAASMASDDGALTDTTAEKPAAHAFWMISKLVRPLTNRASCGAGSSSSSRSRPTTLSTALWRPMSSRTTSGSPPRSNAAAAWTPPVRSNSSCAARTFSGTRSITSTAN